MFERFTDRARRVMVQAQEEARMLNHGAIGTEHILLGVVREGTGVAATALESLGIGLEAVRQQVTEIVGRGERPAAGHIPFTARAKKVLELSLREALQLGHSYIGTEHILLGLIREEEGVAAQVLIRLGADLASVRQQVVTLLRGPGAEESATAGATPRPVPVSWRERSGIAAVSARLTAIEARLSVVEQRVGAGPDESGIDAEFAQLRRDKEAAIDAQDFERAAGLRDSERRLLADQASRQRTWAAAHPDLVTLAEGLRQLRDEVDRLRALLSQHGIEQLDNAESDDRDRAAGDDGTDSGSGHRASAQSSGEEAAAQ